MKYLVYLFIILFPLSIFAQKVQSENLSPKVRLYWDAENRKLQATGSYFTSEVFPNTTEKHGKWLFYSYMGVLEEETNFYKNRIHGKQTIYFPDKKVKSIAFYKFNVPDSTYKEWNKDGKLIISGIYDLGSPNGKWEYFYDNGNKKSVEEVINDTIYIRQYWENDSAQTQTIIDGNGFIQSFYINGGLKEYYSFQNGLKTGPFSEYTAGGALSVGGEFLEGKKNGTWEFFSVDRKLEKMVSYTKDSLDGEYIVFFADGDTMTRGYYSNGNKTGKWFWKNDDQKMDMEGSFDNNLQDGAWTYYFSSGELSYKANFSKGKKQGAWHYFYKNGVDYRKGNYNNDLREGLWQTWYEDGTLLMEGEYEKGKEEGEWRNYWDSGVLKNKSFFKKGKLNGAWLSYTPQRTLVIQGKYKNDLKVGEWRDYYNNGRLKEVNNYKVIKTKNKKNDIVIMGMNELVSEPHGKYEAYSHLDFQLKAKGIYKHGLKHGTWYDYYPGGVIPTVVTQYKNGQLHGVFKEFGRRGELFSEIHYKKGLKDGWFIIYDRNGKESVRKMFSGGLEMMRKDDGNMFAP
jgi:antitoxin component YwqK of YwqJK toxin-antitoxin module